MEIIKLNLIPSGVNPTCHCSQYDDGRVIRIELFDGLTPYVLQSGDTVTLNVRKPDNTIVTASVTATQGNNYVDIVTTEQMCAVVGNNLCDLTITNGSVVIGTLNFYMQIERDVLADGNPSQSVIEDLDARIQEAVGDNYYTKIETDDALALKADKSTTYTKTEVDLALAFKADNPTVDFKGETIEIIGTVKGNIKDIVIYGKTEQAATPLPTVPVYPNNVNGNVFVKKLDNTLISEIQFNGKGIYLGSAIPNVILNDEDLLSGVVNYGTPDNPQYYICDTFEPCVLIDGIYKSRLTKRIDTFVSIDGSGWSRDSFGRINRLIAEALGNGETVVSLCSHYAYTSSNVTNNKQRFTSGNYWLCVDNVNGNTSQDFKQFCINQNTANTPLTIYFVLAEPVVTLSDPEFLQSDNNGVIIGSTSTIKPYISGKIPVTIQSSISKSVLTPHIITAMTYNVGLYNNGSSSGTPNINDVKTKVNNVLNKLNVDILGVQEDVIEIDGSNINSLTYGNYFNYLAAITTGLYSLKSRFEIKSSETLSFSTGRNYLHSVLKVNGIEINVFSTSLSAYEDTRATERAELITALKSHTYSIGLIDTNAGNNSVYTTQTEYDDFINAGLNTANGGYLGILPTYQDGIRCQDSIITTKNIVISNIEIPDVLTEMCSDHLPLKAILSIY